MSCALKLYQPAIISDADNGGGPMVRVEIPPDVDGNLFDRISSLALSRGQVSIREFFLGLDTQDDGKVKDAHIIVRQEPQDDDVSVVLFRLDDQPWVYRSDAADHVEAYTQRGIEHDWRIYGDHPQGLRSIRLWAMDGTRPPGIGDIIVVSDESIDPPWEQYFRVESVAVNTVTNDRYEPPFVYHDAVIELSGALDRGIIGESDPKPEGLGSVNNKVRRGQVAPSARYYGVTPLAADATTGDVDIRVASIYSTVVPSAQAETPILDSPALPQVVRRVDGWEDSPAPAHTDSQAITSANQGLVYTFTLTPKPAAGTFIFEFRTLGAWYTLADNGDGSIGAQGTGGIGTIDYQTGSASVTLEFMPDIDTHTVWSWGSYEQFSDIDSAAAGQARIVQTLGAGIEPGTLSVTWTEGGVGKTATDNGTGGLTGDAAGSINYADGLLILIPTTLPDGPLFWTADSGAPNDSGQASAPVISGGRVTWTSDAVLPIAPGSVTVQFGVQYQWPDGDHSPAGWDVVHHTWLDDGAGQLVPVPGLFAGYNMTIDYATGAIDAPETIPNFTTALRWVGGEWVSQYVTAKYIAGNTITVSVSGTGGSTPDSGDSTGVALTIPLPPGDPVEIGSVRLLMGGAEYTAPELSLDGDNLKLSTWTGGATNDPTIAGGVRRGSEWDATDMHWRTQGAPVRPASITARADTSATGFQLLATTTQGGVFEGDATGTADYEDGYMHTVWNQAIDPWTMVHNGVIVKRVPQDPARVGLDGTRLPADGRVPIFQPGYQVIIHDHAPETLPDNLTPGQQITLQQAGLSTVKIADQNGLDVDDSHYSLDTRTGILTMADPLDMDPFVEPLVAEVYWDDTHPVQAVQATGIVTLSSALKRGYASATARLSSALEVGDLQSHVPIVFDQKTWDGSYNDVIDGDPADGTYNIAAYPIETTNNGAETERWVIRWLNSTHTIEIIGERIGNLGQYDFNFDLAPINPQSGVPYFTVRAAGRGAGWIPGNILRINTQAGAAHCLALRCVNLGAENLERDAVILQPRGPEVV
jgi:hypothetical protein